MADTETRDVTLQVRITPGDNSGPFATMAEAQAAGHDTLNPVTGTYQVGIVDQGAFIPFFEEALALVQPLIDAAKAQAPAEDTSADSSQQG